MRQLAAHMKKRLSLCKGADSVAEHPMWLDISLAEKSNNKGRILRKKANYLSTVIKLLFWDCAS